MKWMIALYLQVFTPRDHEDTGATMVEYALLVSFIAIVALVGITAFGSTLSTFFTGLAARITK